MINEKKIKRKHVLSVSVLLLSLAVHGCVYKPLPFKPNITVDKGQYDEVEECTAQDACLQVFIMYAEMMCSHAALRLQAYEYDTLFWDPAGGFGRKGSLRATRINDLVVSPTPTVNQYLNFRLELETVAVELFEFHISSERAGDLMGRLRGDVVEDGQEKFVTTTTGLFCSDAISAFLERFAGEYIPVKKTFLPRNLAKQLYAVPPDRVILFEEDGNGGFTMSEPPENKVQ